jgi:hypothetical protein
MMPRYLNEAGAHVYQMVLGFWRPSLKGRSVALGRTIGATALALVVGALTTSVLFAQPAAAASRRLHATTASLQAQSGTSSRLENLAIGSDGLIYRKWSDDHGASWSARTVVPSPVSSSYRFIGTPTAVSDGVGRLTVFARDSLGEFSYKTYSNGAWSPAIFWNALPGTDPTAGGGGLQLNGHSYTFVSDPAVTSWGQGRMDLFVYATDVFSADRNARFLLHTWANNSTWSGQWEVRGSGYMQGNPAAVSWGPGRIDIFARGGGNELDHEWYDSGNGGWHGWENKGGILPASPVVASTGQGMLTIFTAGTDQHLWILTYAGGWRPWTDVGCCVITNVSNPIALTSSTPNTVDVFLSGLDHALYYGPFSLSSGWGSLQIIDHSVDYGNISAVAWNP